MYIVIIYVRSKLAKADAAGKGEEPADESSDADTSFGSTASAMERRVLSRPASGFQRLVGETVMNPKAQVKVGNFVLCSLGKTGNMVMEVTEIDWEGNTVTGIYYELLKPQNGEDETFMCKKRDDRDPTLLPMDDVQMLIPAPSEQFFGRRRTKYIFQTLH